MAQLLMLLHTYKYSHSHSLAPQLTIAVPVDICSVPCGRESAANAPQCSHACPVPPLCRHVAALPPHRCHFGPCPQCPAPCGTQVSGLPGRLQKVQAKCSVGQSCLLRAVICSIASLT